MALTTKSVSPLTHFDQSYYNNLKRNVSLAEAEKYRLKVTKTRPKAIDLGKEGAFSKLTEGQIRGYDEQNKIAKEQKKQREKDIAIGKITDLGVAELQEEHPEVQEITRDEVIALLRDNGFNIPGNIRFDTAIRKAQEAGLL